MDKNIDKNMDKNMEAFSIQDIAHSRKFEIVGCYQLLHCTIDIQGQK